MSIGGRPEGRLTFALYDGQAPRTTQNFLMLCTGEKGILRHYKGSRFHRVVPGFICEGGEVPDFCDSERFAGERDCSARKVCASTRRPPRVMRAWPAHLTPDRV